MLSLRKDLGVLEFGSATQSSEVYGADPGPLLGVRDDLGTRILPVHRSLV